MRSCEYLTVQGDRKTKQLRLRNIRFYRHGKEILHRDQTLLNSDYISITFKDQKNGKQFDTITMQSARDLLLCPVRAGGWDHLTSLQMPRHLSRHTSQFILLQRETAQRYG